MEIKNRYLGISEIVCIGDSCSSKHYPDTKHSGDQLGLLYRCNLTRVKGEEMQGADDTLTPFPSIPLASADKKREDNVLVVTNTSLS